MTVQVRILCLLIPLSALICIGLCIFTDINDTLFLPLGLFLAALGNGLNLFYARRQ